MTTQTQTTLYTSHAGHRNYIYLIATAYFVGDVMVDVYGTFTKDGYEVVDVCIPATKINLSSILSVRELERLQERLNDELPSWEQAA